MAAQSDARALLGMARDNKPDAIKAAVALGAPPDFQNPIGQTALMIAALWGNLEAIKALLEVGADPNASNHSGATPLHFAAAAKRNAPAACDLLLAAGADPDAVDDMGCLPFERAEDPELRKRLGGPDQRLFEFAAANDAEGLRQLLVSGAVGTLRAMDREGRHALNLAVAQNNGTGAIAFILDVDPELARVPDMTGSAPIHVAAEAGAEDALRKLLPLLSRDHVNQRNLHLSEYSQGSWLSAKDKEAVTPWDKTALAIAVEAADEDVARMLLDAGADPNIPDYDGASCLHLALEAQEEGLAAMLLERGADPNLASRDSGSCLHVVAQRGPPSLMRLLLQHGADARVADADGWTPLHLAARAGSAEKAEMLLAAGADPSAATKQGHTPLGLAWANSRKEVQRVLEAAGAQADGSRVGGAAPGGAAAAPGPALAAT